MCDTAGVSTYTPYITAIGGVIAGGIISYFVGAKLSQKSHDRALVLLKRQEAHKAFLALEASFLPAIRSLQRNGDDRVTIIPGLFNQQEITMLAFAWHLSGDSKADFEEKWKKYEEWQNKYYEQESFGERGGLLQMGGSNREPLIQIMKDILEAAKKY